jgi:hypothetical protein
MVATDNGTRGRAVGRGCRPWARAALAALNVAASAAQAQAPAAGAARTRRVVLARASGASPATLYAAPDRTLVLQFNVPLGKGAVRAPGVAVQRKASLANALALTPSRAAVRGPIPVTVPLEGGAATFTLVFKSEAPDDRVEVYRPGDSGNLLARKEQRSLIATLGARPLRLEPSNTPVPDAMVKCRVSLRVRTAEVPQGATLEIRTADGPLCESANTLGTRAEGDR